MEAQPLDIDGLSVGYGGTPVLDTLDMHLKAGEARVLFGPNGAGKSTLFNAIAGTVAPSAGSIRIGSVDITRMAPHARARRFLARSFQVPKLSGELTAHEHMMLVGGLDAGEALGIPAFASKAVSELTHGTRKLVEVATALAIRAPVLLLDEPTAGLDAGEKEKVAHVLWDRQKRATLLLIEHDIEFIARLDVPVLFMFGGRVAFEGTLAEVNAFAQAHSVYF